MHSNKPIFSHRYCRLPYVDQPINDDRNLLLLRRDLHHLFDQRRFAFVAKMDGDNPQLVTTFCFRKHLQS